MANGRRTPRTDIDWVTCPDRCKVLGRPPAVRDSGTYPVCSDCEQVMRIHTEL